MASVNSGLKLGDACVDLATGRTVQVVNLPLQTVGEWSGDNNYDLTDNFANATLGADPNEPVVECVYVASIQSEPNGPRGSDSGGYTFPRSRLARVPVERIDGVRRPYDAVAVDVLERLFRAVDDAQIQASHRVTKGDVADLARVAFAPEDVVQEARELADVEQRFGGDDDD